MYMTLVQYWELFGWSGKRTPHFFFFLFGDSQCVVKPCNAQVLEGSDFLKNKIWHFVNFP